MLKRTLIASAMVAAALAPAAQAQSPAAPHAPGRQPSSPPPKRLWYRLTAAVNRTQALDVANPAYTDHRSSQVQFVLESRTAVVLYQQCNATNIAGFDPKLVAELVNAEASAVTCAELRDKMRQLGFSAAEVR